MTVVPHGLRGAGRAPPRPGARRWPARRHLRRDDPALARRAPGQRRGAGAGHAGATASGIGPVLLTGEGSIAPAVAGTQEWRVDTKDLRGLVTTPCGAGGSDLWLLAGGAGPGRQERLVLTNPGANPVTTDVTVHGAAGPLGDPVVETVPPGGRVSVLLDARYGEEAAPRRARALRRRAASRPRSPTRGSTAAPRSVPRRRPRPRRPRPPSRSSRASSSTRPVHDLVRVAVPGDQDAVVRVTVLNRDGLVPWTGESVLSVAGGAVGELPLAGLPEGTYAVAVRSDVPVVASAFVRIGTGHGPGRDRLVARRHRRARTVGGAAFAPDRQRRRAPSTW